ncbi:DUF222 domain-containing protein [Microbacterium esteraromaticum]|uniref:DUF222 domain-containing protein n=1 Tax=Microbacterium esteraromaticum TaxID=57043 RepID=A0A7D8AIR2_9MICO|nr:HNH endonuclease signature motif containing protein [Microbacterium esteraromaticum]QMU96626.1 DUF222 domain-containing protein [Microbacterium esteraromaticum]
MNGIATATAEDMANLDALVSSLQAVEKTLQGVLAARDGLLAVANRLAMSIAEQGEGLETSDLTLRAVAAELAAALRVSDRTVQRRMLAAEVLVERFPQVWQAQGCGAITAGHARVIVEAGAHIDDATARAAYSERVIALAHDDSPNRVRVVAERIAQQYQERSLEERHEDARENRGVWVTDLPDAMSELHMYGPSVLVHGAHARLTEMARALEVEKGAGAGSAEAGLAGAEGAEAGLAGAEGAGAGHARADGDDPGRAVADRAADARTRGRRRFDLALDMLLTGTPLGHDSAGGMLGAITAQVSVTVPVTTLMGESGPSAEIDGRVPVDPATARRLAGAASGWDRVLTHPVTAGVLAVDRYRPPDSLRRTLRARDQRCRFSGCGMPARDSDLDHTRDAAFGGETSEENLAALCRRHHVLKHQTPWHVVQLGGGLLEWTSPTGRTYVDRPPPPNTVTFIEAPF